MSGTKLTTTGDVYWAILKAHANDLTVFETFSDPDGSFTGGSRGEVLTVWGLKGSDFPIMGARTTWDIVRVEIGGADWVATRANQVTEFWLCKNLEANRD